MLSKNNPQIDVFTQMIYDKLVPQNHLLVKINSLIDFSFIYDIVEDCYSKNMGRSSRDPLMMIKIILLEYLYNLSDVEVAKRIATDIVFRWFLGLSIDDSVPDDTTISHFRVKRLGKEKFEAFFNEIVRLCIKQNLVNSNRFLIDSTDVSVNASLPFGKKLIRDAYQKVIRQVETFNEDLAKEFLESFEQEIAKEYENPGKVEAAKHFEIALGNLNKLYVKTNEEIEANPEFQKAFQVCYDIADHYLHQKKDKIVSVVDTDARAAYKSPRNPKVGYKDHIIVDEDSEIILASVQTPFNVGDEKKLVELLNKVEENFELKPKEVTADKAYGTMDNRAHLKDKEIVSNIAFYNEPDGGDGGIVFGIRDFRISEDGLSVTCPNNITTAKFVEREDKKRKSKYRHFVFSKNDCDQCPLREQCLKRDKKSGKIRLKHRRLMVFLRYDAILNDLKRVETEDFKAAYAKRFKVERRFATMVANHGLRRSRYIGMERSSIHIIIANAASNIIRMVNLLCQTPAILT